MNNVELENIAKNLIETTELAGRKSIELRNQGLKTIIKPDNSPVTNGDLEVNKILTEKIKSLTPNIPIITIQNFVHMLPKNTIKRLIILTLNLETNSHSKEINACFATI